MVMGPVKPFTAQRLVLTLAIIIVMLIALVYVTMAQTPKPVLTEVQRLQVQNIMQQLELAQVRLALAQAELERARQNTQSYLQTLVVKDYTLDLSTLTYAPLPLPAEKK